MLTSAKRKEVFTQTLNLEDPEKGLLPFIKARNTTKGHMSKVYGYHLVHFPTSTD